MELELGRSRDTEFANPDFVATRRALEPAAIASTLREALAQDTLSVIACPVDYAANIELTDALGDMDGSLA
jgi:acetolactate synthase-1/2/3 large subunit